ncbi:MAG: hypothetical protein EOQ50_10065 [Mesorhizobium sp.]|uniref:hypothetical protein n=1 Tax=Mesorhizobium sp. TaxID=1871066 RepID=UPI000FE9A76A|nr:hypothetical protein [Mesorhizobium sp.]RWB77240.1 MAG: hypothetical protein EOQ50_10065 [Mesorhizobium sp.]RWL83643.1 MAG: hypothetical protein EOR69_12945 [Mesorhizobium sp.]RWL90795.1 MAG: hypothetical protein EOR67_05285 [Mesorhizobium sp.]RWL93281.1 MAG: hypothetical protein EOR70_28955 [Mesorhizobium sp.]RWL98541.1 MAG: hypothetical protein EOR68_14950 [Mesorhizobium sp.]
MHARTDTSFAPTSLSRGEALSMLSAGIAGPCCGEANEMLAWLYLLPPTETAPGEARVEPSAARRRSWLGLLGMFRA